MLLMLFAEEAMTLAWLRTVSIQLVASNQSKFTRCFYLRHLNFLKQHWDQPLRSGVLPSSVSKWLSTELLRYTAPLQSSYNRAERTSWHVLSCISVLAQGSLGAKGTITTDIWYDPKANVWSVQVQYSGLHVRVDAHRHSLSNSSQCKIQERNEFSSLQPASSSRLWLVSSCLLASKFTVTANTDHRMQQTIQIASSLSLSTTGT